MMCPLLTKDPVNNPVPCLENCSWKVQGLCAVNVIAQSLYHREQRANQKDFAEKQSRIDTASMPD